MQKLKMSFFHLLESLFTCFLKDKTLHNHWDYAGFTVPYYNIPSNNRELQHTQEIRISEVIITYQVITGNYSLRSCLRSIPTNYNIPSNNRELQRSGPLHSLFFIITYQVITGNYSIRIYSGFLFRIITYQVITGNYSI